jgi:7-carboxy-7-deazaguanine synthase (Cx14CxxC type)
MTYVVKEIFATLQGEGGQQGRAAVFCRFAGCNLWSGREADRATAVCRFCDTEFVGGDRFADAGALAQSIATAWPAGAPGRFVVFTGGEPMLQLDAALLDAVHALGFEAAIETNGTLALVPGLDWVCVSPKAGAQLVVTAGDELKVVFPQPGLDLDALAALPFRHRWLSPMDGPAIRRNMADAAAFCLANPVWRLNIQAHKVWDIR